MLKTLKNINWIIFFSVICVFLGILTFLTFINQSFIPLNDENLQRLLIIDLILLIVFFYLIIKNIYRIYIAGKKKKAGYKTNLKYISFFSLFTFIPSFIVAIFSLIVFNYGVQNFFDSQITKAVNNSYDVAKNYLEESKKNVKSDIILMSDGLNRVSNLFYLNKKNFSDVLRAEKLLRRIDDVYLIDSQGNIIMSNTNNPIEDLIVPNEDEYNTAIEGNPVFISADQENKTSVMIKLNSLVDTYLYISRDIEPEILNYLNETEEAVSFYYSVENSQTGIKITFAIIYIIIVTLLLFISILFAMSFATRLTNPITNLISASQKISKGELTTKVPIQETDKEIKILIENFNNMIERLKKQQDKLLLTERYEAWETVARKLAHEIKNPLTPIQLSIDRLREKYSSKFLDKKSEFEKYLQIISRQIKDIEKLTNEFSNFARMPRPILKKNKIFDIIQRAVDLKKIESKNQINLIKKNKDTLINVDEEQLYRVFLNLIKNSEDSFAEKAEKNSDFKGKIDIEITSNNDYITILFSDNGTGIKDTKQVMTPYYTTKSNGTGLGLPIVNKIINEHSGDISLKNKSNKNGLLIEINLPK